PARCLLKPPPTLPHYWSQPLPRRPLWGGLPSPFFGGLLRPIPRGEPVPHALPDLGGDLGHSIDLLANRTQDRIWASPLHLGGRRDQLDVPAHRGEPVGGDPVLLRPLGELQECLNRCQNRSQHADRGNERAQR